MDTKKRKTTDEGKGDAPTVDQIKTWLGGMSREDAVQFIAEMAVEHSVVYDAIQSKIQGDPTFTKLFVRSLDWSTTDESLHTLFIQYGPIQEAVVLKDQMTGKSKGFGFVTFETPEAAFRALQEKNKSLDGREISVHLASEKNTRPPTRSFGSTAPNFAAWTSSPAAAGAAADRRLFVRGLAWETTTASLQTVFEQYGPILEAAVITDRETGRSKGFGFVTFQTPEGARAALTQPDKYIDGRLSSCSYAVDRPKNLAPGAKSLGPVAIPTGTDPIQQQLQELQQQQLQLQQRIVNQQQQQLQQQQQQLLTQQQPAPYQQGGFQQPMQGGPPMHGGGGGGGPMQPNLGQPY